MKVRLYMMIQDPRFAPVQGTKRLIEGYDVENIEFSDGPTTDSVAVVDIDAETNKLIDGAKLLQPKRGNVLWKFDLPHPAQIDIESRTFNQVSVMATVLKTIALYEDADVLGRPVRWRWETSERPKTPLKVIPRWQEREGAFYKPEPAKQWLEFNYFRSNKSPHEMIYTSLSRDVVAHETGHAILDGIAPHLIDFPTYQSQALHEAIGDITGLLIAISSGNLRKEVLAKTKGSIDNATYFSGIGEEYGMATKDEHTAALRDLYDKDYEKVMSKVDHTKPHFLCGVLTAALYSVLIKMHNKWWNEYSRSSDNAARYSNSGKALYASSQQFKRMTLRALDYLPPGQIQFADYARAVIAADQAAHPDDKEERQWIVDEFIKRKIVADEAALTVTAPAVEFGEVDLDLHLLVRDDAAARSFAEKYRMLLRIPDKADFTVEPRLEVCKKYYHRSECDEAQSEPRTVKECLFKVWWRDPERDDRVKGTTLAIHWKTRRLRALLTSDHSDRPTEEQTLQADLAGAAYQSLAFVCCR